MKLAPLIDGARKSSWKMWRLNLALAFVIPFNRPHGFKIVEISEDHVRVKIPYKRKNLNHLKGLHACAMATAAEFASGILLLYKLGEKEYRLVMQSLELEYLYQGRMEAEAEFRLVPGQLEASAIEPLKTQEKVLIRCEVLVKDRDGNLLCKAYPNWQLKRWDKVRTK